jgi:hypothetical protein
MRIARGDEAKPDKGAAPPPVANDSEPGPPRIAYAFARRHGLLPVAEQEGRLTVAMRAGADPQGLIDLLQHEWPL